MVTGLLLGVWTTASVGAAVADAAIAAPGAVGAHVESPDAAGDHAATHAHDCAFCQALQWTSLGAAPIVPPAVPVLVSTPTPAAPSHHADAGTSRGVARAPPAQVA